MTSILESFGNNSLAMITLLIVIPALLLGTPICSAGSRAASVCSPSRKAYISRSRPRKAIDVHAASRSS